MSTKTMDTLGWALVAMAATGWLLVSEPAALAQTGEELYVAKGCVACHGVKGAKPIQSAYPKLNGQNAAYSVSQLQAYKEQKRTSTQSVLMWGMAAQLSEAEMRKIAEYLAGAK